MGVGTLLCEETGSFHVIAFSSNREGKRVAILEKDNGSQKLYRFVELDTLEPYVESLGKLALIVVVVLIVLIG